MQTSSPSQEKTGNRDIAVAMITLISTVVLCATFIRGVDKVCQSFEKWIELRKSLEEKTAISMPTSDKPIVSKVIPKKKV